MKEVETIFGEYNGIERINFGKYNGYQYIISYINQYCADSITNIRLTQIPGSALNQFKKPFTRIEKVNFGKYEGQHQLPKNWLNRLFPKMRILNC